MDNQKQQVAERVKEANNILVTVSANPSVDQLAACIGVTLALNKMGKHATAVFSGQVPSILEFLQPEKTIEKNTDSLRDFIIALDKSKADKLRYKVEDRVVKIFITPYRTSISDKDLEFSQGDFNVDVVLALGVHNQSDLDQAITAHGRILHDAAVITLNNKTGGELGVLNWLDPTASSLSELTMQLVDMLDKSILDEQIATAMLTGIVAETERFSNAKTTPRTMSISAELMTAGANQQLVATKLEEPVVQPSSTQQAAAPTSTDHPPVSKKSDDGTLEIAHDEPAADAPAEVSDESDAATEKPADNHQPSQPEEPEVPEAPAPEAPADTSEKTTTPPQIHIDEHGSLQSLDTDALPRPHSEPPTISHHAEAPKMILEPPTLGGQLTASGMPDAYELLPSDPLTLPGSEPAASTPSVAPTIMPPTDDAADASDEHGPEETLPAPALPQEEPAPEQLDAPLTPELPEFEQSAPSAPASSSDSQKTLSELERDVHSSHLDAPVDPPVQTLPDPSAPLNATAFDPAAFNAPVVEPSAQPAADATAPEASANQEAVDVQEARDAVMHAINGSTPAQLPPIEALNAQPVNLPIGSAAEPAQPAVSPIEVQQPPVPSPAWETNTPAGAVPFQPSFTAAPPQQPPANPGVVPGAMPAPVSTPQAPAAPVNPNAPPPVPPPMMPPAF